MASSAAPSRTVSLKEKAAALRAGDVDAIIERALRAIGLDPADPRSATAQIPFDRLPRSMHQSLAKFLKITTSSIPVIHSGTPEQGIVMTQLVEFVSLMDKNAVQFDPTVPHSFILLHNSQQRTACSFPAPSPAAASGAKARAKITLVNPFSIAVRVARVSARVAVDGVFLATSQNDVDFTLPAGSVAFDDPAHPGRPVPRPSEEFCTPPLVAWLDVSWKAVAAVVRRFRGGTLKVSVWCEVEAFVGTFRTTLEFIQDDVPVSFVWSIS
ncbi:hypothetical protein DFJ73DRAFT_764499 [Zopfochytrium polystomum]|nr:hypothetical protein DFJ73DRAFT_764499 [Zopfochytrium polystomum]